MNILMILLDILGVIFALVILYCIFTKPKSDRQILDDFESQHKVEIDELEDEVELLKEELDYLKEENKVLRENKGRIPREDTDAT